MSHEPGGFDISFDEEHPQQPPGYPQGYAPPGYQQPPAGYQPQGYADQGARTYAESPQPYGGYQPGTTQADGVPGRTMRDGGPEGGDAGYGGPDQGASTLADGAGGHGGGGADVQALVGRKVDRYYIKKLLGEGGFGAVYLAEHALMKRDVAFKTLHKELAQDPAILYRFRREGQCAGRFRHKNAIELYDFGQMDDGTYFMAMEFMRGEDLRDYVKRKGALELGETFDIMIQALAAIQAMHDGGVIHRDLKPDNIKLEKEEGLDYFVKVFDFGIAKLLDDDPSQEPRTDARGYLDQSYEDTGQRYKTQVGAFFGTPEYGSPEQCAGEDIDYRSDLYTMGVILYECLSGALPFSSKTPQGYLAQHMVAEPRPIAEINPELKVPAEVEAIVHKAMAKDRNERYQSAREFAEALEDCAQKLGIQLKVDTSIVTVVRTPVWKLALMTLVPVLAIAGGAYYYVSTRPQGDPKYAGLQQTIANLETSFDYASALEELEGEDVAELRQKYPDYFYGKDASGVAVTDPGAIATAATKGKIQELREAKERRDAEIAAFRASIHEALGQPAGQRDFDALMEQIDAFEATPRYQPAGAKQIGNELGALVTERREEEAEGLKESLRAAAAKVDAGELLQAKNVYVAGWLTNKYGPTRSFPAATKAHDWVQREIKRLDEAFQSQDPRDKIAAVNLKGIVDYIDAHQEDWPGALKQLADFQAAYGDTKSGPEAQSLKVRVEKAWDDAAAKARDALKASVANLLAKGEVPALDEALKAIAAFPAIHRQRDVAKGPVDDLRESVRKEATSRFEKALAESQQRRSRGRMAEAIEPLQAWTGFEGGPEAARARQTIGDLDQLKAFHSAERMVPIPAVEGYIIGDWAMNGGNPVQVDDPKTFKAFFIDKHEVTNAEYLLFLRANGRMGSAPRHWSEGWTPTDENPFNPEIANHPVRYVTWREATEFAAWCGKRLPTEFEWEYAGRGPVPWIDDKRAGPSKHAYWSWGGESPDKAKVFGMACLQNTTSPVGSFPVDTCQKFNVVDMVGNVREWTSSPFVQYEKPKATRVLPVTFNPSSYVIRGGSFDFGKTPAPAMEARLPARRGGGEAEAFADVGFRCAKDAE